MTILETEVLIVGGGPSGLVSALCLGMYGIPHILIERQAEPHVHPKAHELSGRSLEILLQLGVPFEALVREASPHEDASRVLFCESLQREFGCIDLAALPDADKYPQHVAAPRPYLNVSQVAVERALLEQVRSGGRTDLRLQHQWESFAPVAEGMRSRVTDRQRGETLEIQSRHVICADGAGSRTRKALGVEMIGPESLRDVVSAYFEADLSGVVSTRGKLYFIFNPASPGVLIAHHIERRWVFHAIVATPHEKPEDFTEEVLQARIRAAVGVPELPVQIRSLSPWRMTAQLAARYRVGAAFLVGDAAHRFPPTGGLGMNSGIGDAHNLCWKLAAVLQGRAPDTLLDTYETERRPVAKVNCEESRINNDRLSEVLGAFGIDPTAIDRLALQMSQGPMRVLPAWGQSWVRRQLNRYGTSVLSRFRTDPEVHARVLTAIAEQQPHFDRIGLDLGYRYREGALLPDISRPALPHQTVSTYCPTTDPGARLPHFWLDGRRCQISSHSWIDYRRSVWVLGAGCPLSADDRAALEAAASSLSVRVVSLADPPIPPSVRAEVHVRCHLQPDGALMVRPDGHISWRQGSGVRPDVVLLRSILEESLRAA